VVAKLSQSERFAPHSDFLSSRAHDMSTTGQKQAIFDGPFGLFALYKYAQRTQLEFRCSSLVNGPRNTRIVAFDEVTAT
jgi:hypothetical protein